MTLFNLAILTIIIFPHMLMMIIITSGSRILVARIIQFEVESNCETFLQMSIISISIRASPLSSLNVKYYVALVTRQYDHHITTYYDDNYDNHHRRILSYCCQGECSHPCIGTSPLPRGRSGRVPQFNGNNNDDYGNDVVDP